MADVVGAGWVFINAGAGFVDVGQAAGDGISEVGGVDQVDGDRWLQGLSVTTVVDDPEAVCQLQQLYGVPPAVVREIPSATFRRCRTCWAYLCDPFPDNWSLELVKEGPAVGPVKTFGTPHHPGCTAPVAAPDPGIAVRVPGKHVGRLDFPPVPPVPEVP